MGVSEGIHDRENEKGRELALYVANGNALVHLSTVNFQRPHGPSTGRRVCGNLSSRLTVPTEYVPVAYRHAEGVVAFGDGQCGTG